MRLQKVIPLLFLTLVNSYSFSTTLYVDQFASGANNGSSWANAYIELNDAITNASSGDAIWIAAGNYKPDWNGSSHTGNRNLSFSLPANISLYGGFVGNETLLSQRNWGTNQTVLTGDLNGDDVVTFPTFTNYTENSARLFFIANSSSGIVLDGLIIQGANNNISWGGGGITSMAPDIIINNCIFRHNTSAATIETPLGRMTLENCLLYENECGWGATIYAHDLGVTMTNCTVVNNSSSSNPAGLGNLSYMQGCEIVNCIFWGNTGSAATTEKNQINENTDPNGLPVFENNIVEGYTGILQHMGSVTNVAVNPGFINSAIADFRLNTSSLAIDAGDMSYISSTVDLDLLSRVINGQVDIGAYETTVIPLPIELLSFEATKVAHQVRLNWITASEINNDFFTVERSIDALYWEPILTQKGFGNSANILEYTAIDNHPMTGVSYYRLKQTDFDGDFSYSNIVPIKFEQNIELSVYPNPTTDCIVISHPQKNQSSSSLKVYNMQGQLVLNKEITKENINLQLGIEQLPNGHYFIKISNQNNTLKGSFIKH